jgi:hypothetical protein
MSYCAGKSQAKVTVNGQEPISFISNNPPVDVTVLEKQISRVTGEGLNLSNCGGLGNTGTIQFNGYVELVSVTVQGCSGLKPSVDGVLAPGTGDVYYPATVTVNHFKEWELKIFDATGLVFSKIFSTEPKYTVACDDDCPEGSYKCTHNKYPGYCCVPCKKVGDRLKNIANKVGR